MSSLGTVSFRAGSATVRVEIDRLLCADGAGTCELPVQALPESYLHWF